MSTNKTTNFGLHLWEAGDDFLRAEFNENFSAVATALAGLDGAMPRLTFGAYQGDDTLSRVIPLGFTPTALFLFRSDGATSSGTQACGGFVFGSMVALYDKGLVVKIVEGGFQVAREAKSGSYYQADTNNAHFSYYYLALQ